MFRKDFLPRPDPFWSFASVSARPFWCILHPHPMFARTFLSAPVTSPSCTFQALGLIFSLCFGGSLISSGLFCWSPLPSQTQDPFLWVHSSWRRGVRGVGGAGDQGPGFPPNSKGPRLWKPLCLSLLLVGIPPSQLFPALFKPHLLWVAVLIAPRVPKDSVLITGLTSMFLICFYPSASHTLKAEPWSCVTHFCHLVPCQSSGQSQCF